VHKHLFCPFITVAVVCAPGGEGMRARLSARRWLGRIGLQCRSSAHGYSRSVCTRAALTSFDSGEASVIISGEDSRSKHG
jgi:hypothetical protein